MDVDVLLRRVILPLPRFGGQWSWRMSHEFS